MTPAPAQENPTDSAVSPMVASTGLSRTQWPLLFAVSGWAAAVALLFVLVSPSARVAGPLDLRATLIEIAPDAQTLTWSTAGITGDVTWSDARNEGYVRITGLPVNDPTQHRYQLWIFRSTDLGAEPHPVDGGVFDVTGGGETVLVIDARIHVGRAGLFTVTVEGPAGAVVSEREQVVAVASRA